MATDKAREELQNDLANPEPNIFNRIHGVLKNTAIKCKGMVCGKSTETSDPGCPYTKESK